MVHGMLQRNILPPSTRVKMEAGSLSVTMVTIYTTTCYHMPDDHCDNHCCETLNKQCYMAELFVVKFHFQNIENSERNSLSF
jgi:hypothetical protein